MNIYKRYIKRILDLLFSGIALVILSPVLMVVAIIVRFKLGSPIIFKQKRPGKNEEIFTLYKFRSMSDIRDEKGQLLPDNMRLTRFGKLLRASSLDELPELWNIFIGDMSFIGPRPLLVEYLSLYDNYQKRRHEVRPGLTGLAQVSGRNSISWRQKFNLDVKYVSSFNFILDIKILFKTIKEVFMRDGIEFTSSENIYDALGNNISNEKGNSNT